jgi:pimeloyl-ACP methyl ester carboxylesterase
MATFVLIPGAWLGGWCWRRLTPKLRTAGHEVYTPTLTGLGERAHLTGLEINLDTHIQDVVSVLECEELQDVVLLGHSYAGLVVSGVAERVPERIARIVFLDALVGQDGQSFFDIAGPEFAEMVKGQVKAAGGKGWPMASERPGTAGLTDADERWLQSHASLHPVGTLDKPVRLSSPKAAALPRDYILCTRSYAKGEPVPDMIRGMCAEMGWQLHEIPTGHWPMVSDPELLADVLNRLA